MPTLEKSLNRLNRLVGTWSTEATHPALPGTVVHGTAVVEWLEGERFLIHRARTDHKDFPDAISIIGVMNRDRVDSAKEANPSGGGEPRLEMHYFDSRGVFRDYEVSVDDQAWRWWRDSPGFSQRFTGTFTEGDDTIVGVSQLCRDDVHWNDDLQITYRRRK
jgi:hypothetical protein